MFTNTTITKNVMYVNIETIVETVAQFVLISAAVVSYCKFGRTIRPFLQCKATKNP